MIVWLAPVALAAFALVAAPVLVHLLARRHAERVPFPAVHFVRPSRAAAVRLRAPSDLPLMLVRMTAVGAAALAVAQPVLTTRARIAGWNARTVRAVVLDTSRSMLADGNTGPRLAAAQASSAFDGREFAAADLSVGVHQALAWMESAPPARREIVVISDFQRGALDEETVRSIPPGIGVRLVRSGTVPATRSARLAPVDGWRDGRWRPLVDVDPAGTRATWTREGSQTPPSIAVIASPADQAAAGRALQAALSAGVVRSSDERRVVVMFSGAQVPAVFSPLQPIHSRWIANAALALGRGDLVRDTGGGLSSHEHDGVLIVQSRASGASATAAAVIRATIEATASPLGDPELEVATTADAELAGWAREPPPLTGLAHPGPDDSSSRWLWGLALAALAAESWLRRTSRRNAAEEVHASAA